jgi:uncharacterized protein YecE (DUF72 family)
VGTAGWSLGSRYLETLPAGGTHLERYGRAFSVVEIDTSFYRHHQAQTYARWAHSVGKDFRFAVKTPRSLTHEGGLVCGKNADLSDFLREIEGLGPKLRVLLVQLPPRLEFDGADVRRFFRRLRRGIRDTTAIVCEPRHASWGTGKADTLLKALGVARAAVDPPRWGDDARPAGDTCLAYFRMHGSPRIYYSDYGAARLDQLGAALKESLRKSDQVWCIFDNTAHGHAIGNALTLKESIA